MGTRADLGEEHHVDHCGGMVVAGVAAAALGSVAYLLWLLRVVGARLVWTSWRRRFEYSWLDCGAQDALSSSAVLIAGSREAALQ